MIPAHPPTVNGPRHRPERPLGGRGTAARSEAEQAPTHAQQQVRTGRTPDASNGARRGIDGADRVPPRGPEKADRGVQCTVTDSDVDTGAGVEERHGLGVVPRFDENGGGFPVDAEPGQARSGGQPGAEPR
jgi:hypothetical protein